MKRPLVTCPHCLGRGKSKLSDALFEVFEIITDDWQSTQQLFLHFTDKPWLKATALSNRLACLMELKFIDCEQRGKAKFWRLKK